MDETAAGGIDSDDVTIDGIAPGVFDGSVVVIDVIRAFTTAAAAFAAGAREIRCVESIDHALALGAELEGSLVMGEERGLPPPGFDLGNSPCQFGGVGLDGRIVIQRTSNGTRGLAQVDAPLILAAAATNVAATARLAATMMPVRLVCTALTSEDQVCAEHLAALLRGERPSPERTRERILAADAEHRALWTRPRTAADIAAHEADLAACAEIDRYPFAMVGRRTDDVVVLTRHDA